MKIASKSKRKVFIMANYIELYKHWLNSPALDEKSKAELLEIANDDNAIKERFSKEIEFGTAGLRGVLGAGTNRINKYIVRKVTEGYAAYIKANGAEACKRGIVIAHDNRRCSSLI